MPSELINHIVSLQRRIQSLERKGGGLYHIGEIVNVSDDLMRFDVEVARSFINNRTSDVTTLRNRQVAYIRNVINTETKLTSESVQLSTPVVREYTRDSAGEYIEDVGGLDANKNPLPITPGGFKIRPLTDDVQDRLTYSIKKRGEIGVVFTPFGTGAGLAFWLNDIPQENESISKLIENAKRVTENIGFPSGSVNVISDSETTEEILKKGILISTVEEDVFTSGSNSLEGSRAIGTSIFLQKGLATITSSGFTNIDIPQHAPEETFEIERSNVGRVGNIRQKLGGAFFYTKDSIYYNVRTRNANSVVFQAFERSTTTSGGETTVTWERNSDEDITTSNSNFEITSDLLTGLFTTVAPSFLASFNYALDSSGDPGFLYINNSKNIVQVATEENSAGNLTFSATELETPDEIKEVYRRFNPTATLTYDYINNRPLILGTDGRFHVLEYTSDKKGLVEIGSTALTTILGSNQVNIDDVKSIVFFRTKISTAEFIAILTHNIISFYNAKTYDFIPEYTISIPSLSEYKHDRQIANEAIYMSLAQIGSADASDVRLMVKSIAKQSTISQTRNDTSDDRSVLFVQSFKMPISSARVYQQSRIQITPNGIFVTDPTGSRRL